MDTELKLWTGLRNGDKEALESIYMLCATKLFNYGTKFCADTNLVQDEIHDLFVYLFEKRKTLSPNVSLIPYLLTSLRRRILVRLKNKSILADEIHDSFSLDISFEQHIIDFEIENEVKSSIKNAINSLSEREKEIVYLKYFANLGNADISDVMRINDQATRNLLSKSLKKMRSMVSDTRYLSLVLLSL